MKDTGTSPNRKEKHNARVRARILTAAGAMFRASGYEAAGIDGLMAGAGLTRGAFYAHFASKEALFVEIVAADSPMLTRLRARRGTDPVGLWEGLLQVLDDYLNIDKLETTVASCTLVAFGQDARLGAPSVKKAYETAHRAMLAEMVRGQPVPADDPRVIAILDMIVGAVTTAAAAEGHAHKAEHLEAAKSAITVFLKKVERSGAGQGVEPAA